MTSVAKTLDRLRHKPEEGFTLIELLVVILIIGILSAIAIPAFMNQRKSAVEASLKSDLRNAATMMTGEYAKTGKFPTAIPNYSQFSDGNLISVMGSKSNFEQFCLRGTNKTLDSNLHISSKSQGFDQECSDLPSEQQSFNIINSTKKVLIVRSLSEYTVVPYMKKALLAQGYQEDNISVIDGDTLTKEMTKDTELLILANQAWSAKYNDLVIAYEFYMEGGDVFVEGNDSRPTQFSDGIAMPSSRVNFTATHNQLSPAFPYSFKNNAFPADTWVCATNLKNGAISIATDEINGTTCHTMFGAVSPSGGQYFYLVYANAGEPNVEFSQTHAGLSWLSN